MPIKKRTTGNHSFLSGSDKLAETVLSQAVMLTPQMSHGKRFVRGHLKGKYGINNIQIHPVGHVTDC